QAAGVELGGQQAALGIEGDARDGPKALGPDLRLVPGNDPVDAGRARIGRDTAQQADAQRPVRPDRHRAGHGLRLDGDGLGVSRTPAGNCSATVGKRASIDTRPVAEMYSRSLAPASATAQPPRYATTS